MNNVMPELSLAVVRILRLISQSTDIQSEIIGTLASKKVLLYDSESIQPCCFCY